VNKIDWNYLRRPLLWLVMATVIAAALVTGGYQFEKLQHEDYQQSVSALRLTHQKYKNIVNDIDLLDQYRTLYIGYKFSGLVGLERRLSWVESLDATNEVLQFPKLTYNLSPQEDFVRPEFKVKRGVLVQSSAMELNMGLLHEEDLFALFEGLRMSIKNLFTVDSCVINRSGGVGQKLATKSTNLAANCQIRWVTIDAK
jgi:hypothetical protein